jgi:integral membrane protein|tara:strand:+ start:724 stop:978 length:255 start_codon:yes stop_codon:yes gene_type:complete
MPLKYLNDMPQAVTAVGTMHGFLFILYMLALGQTLIQLKHSLGWAAKVIVAAVFPFGPFFIEADLRHEQVKLEQNAGTNLYKRQ